jgi:hypothetical protein
MRFHEGFYWSMMLMNWLLEDMAVLSLSPVNIGVCYHRAELESGRIIHREARHVNCDQLLPGGTIVVIVLHLAAGTASSAMVEKTAQAVHQ